MRKLTRFLDASGALAVFAYAAFAAARGARLQWDFRVYLDATRAARAGLDPYALASLEAVSHKPAHLPFLYPPAALVPFLGLSFLPLPVALALWATLKVVLLALLVVLWKRVFVPAAPWVALALVAVFGSNAAALWDVRSGNVGLVEAGLLWSALALRVRGRDGWFAVLVVLAAIFKLLPGVFLLLLLADGRPRWRLFAGALAALLAVVFVPVHLVPWRNFLHVVSADVPHGEANPALYSWLRATSPVGVFVWLGAAIALVRLAWPRFRNPDRCAQAITFVLLYLLISPRPMAYGWVLGGGALVACAWAAVPSGLARAALVAGIALQGLLWATANPLAGPLAENLPWIVALLLGLLATFAARAGRLQEAARA